MGDRELEVSGGGSTIVATDAMLADAQALVEVEAGLGGLLVDLRITAASLHDAGIGYHVSDEVERALRTADEAQGRAQFIAEKLTLAMEVYSEVEAKAEWLAVNGAGLLAFFSGAAVRHTLTIALGPWLAPVALALPWLARELAAGERELAPDDIVMSDEVTRLLSDPAFVDALRLAVSSADEAVRGFGGYPAYLQSVLAASGITGVGSSALLIAYWGSFAGLLTETPVTVERTAIRTTSPTAGFVSRLDSIPQPGSMPGSAQIRIDRIEQPGSSDRFEVFIGGTVDFKPLAGSDAFDLTSNVAGVGGLPAGSLRAVQQAMADAGVTSSSEVVFTGHSQGGLIAATLAASGDYNTRGVVTVGAPIGHILLPAGVPAVIIENKEDFVTSLGGMQTNTEAVIVRNEVFGDAGLPSGVSVPGHRIDAYLVTAAQLDKAGSRQIREVGAHLDAFSADATTVTSTLYYASRVAS